MALDVFGNWVPPILDMLDGEIPTGGAVLTGVGAPSDLIGNNGNIYIDSSTGDLYTKSGDTWTLFSGGGGGTTEVLGGAADPTGTLTVSGRAIYIQDADVNGDRRIYVKNTAASNNTDWQLVLTYQA